MTRPTLGARAPGDPADLDAAAALVLDVAWRHAIVFVDPTDSAIDGSLDPLIIARRRLVLARATIWILDRALARAEQVHADETREVGRIRGGMRDDEEQTT